MSYLQLHWEAQEDAIYAYWDNLDAQERLNWLECYEVSDRQQVIMLPLDEVFSKLAYRDMVNLSEDILSEFEAI